MQKTVVRFLGLSLSVLTLTTCARNPATGGLQLMLVSEGQEIQMGQQADPEVLGSFGLYPDSGLQEYVRNIGHTLAGLSERPQLPWSFRVVDDPIVNAFALPGGFIYVTRGILSHFNSEAQLASVLGHEIGHVTARHSASQMSQQQLAQVGLGVGMILVPDLQDFLGAASVGLGLLFLKNSRDDEREADYLGFRYMQKGSWDPRAMPGVFAMLGAVSAAAGGDRLPGWLSTHPDPEDREQRIQQLIAQSTADFGGMRVAQNEYLRRLDGLIYGPNPREGFFRGARFLHPDLQFQLAFPEGWKTANQKQAVLAQSPDEGAIIQLTLAEQGSPVAAAREFVGQEGVTGGRIQTDRINGLPAAVVGFTAATEQATLRGLVAFVAYNGLVYRLLAYSLDERWSQYAGAAQRTFSSFDRVTDQAVLNVQPMRIRIVSLPARMSVRQYAERYPAPESVETLALLNQVDPDEPLASRRLIKHVVGRRVE